MFYQIKMIRKKDKPPTWRRAYVPSNITFTQMALILEELLEYPKSDWFEFEFYQKKVRLIEWHEEDKNIHDVYYDYLNAPDTFVNDWFMQEQRFTFRIRGMGLALPEYRVEVEKILEDVTFSANHEKLNYPLLLKEKSSENDLFWNRDPQINERLKDKYWLREGKAQYLYLEELKKEIEDQHAGYEYSMELIDRNIHSKKSTNSMIKDIADMISAKAAANAIEDLKNRMGYDEATETFSASEETQSIAEEVVAKIAVNMEKDVKAALSDYIPRGLRRAATIEGLLSSYTKQELLEIADELEFKLQENRKDKIVYEIARHLLLPDNMRYYLLDASEEELDIFEEAMEKRLYLPDEEERLSLEVFVGLNYLVVYNDDYIEVPDEVKLVYSIIKKNGYREYHKQTQWLQACLTTFDMIHVVAPVEVLYKMYKCNAIKDISYTDFCEMIKQFPEKSNPCEVVGDKLISKQAVKNNLYRRLEQNQRNVEYYIPTKQEILSYSANGFPAQEKTYRIFWMFLRNELDLEEKDCEYFCIAAFRIFSSGGMLSDFMKIMNEKSIEFKSQRQVESFAQIMMEVNNYTRMYELKGHKPLEIRHMTAPKRENATKVYPNDPCPCGSGKKYKKCCGKK